MTQSRLRGYEPGALAGYSGARESFEPTELAREGQLLRERPGTAFGQGIKSSQAGMEAGRISNEMLQAEREGDLGRFNQLRGAYERAMGRSEAFAPRVQSLADVDGLGDALNFAGGAVGGMAATTTPSLVAGAATAALTRGRLRTPATYTAAAAPAYPLERNQAVLEQYQDPVIAEQDPETRARASQVRGLAGAGAEAVMPALISRRLLSGGPLSSAVKEGAISGTVTEGAQAKMSQMHRGYLNPDRDTSGDTQEIIDAAAAGAIGGTAIGGGVVGGAQAVGAGIQTAANALGRRRDDDAPPAPTPDPGPIPAAPGEARVQETAARVAEAESFDVSSDSKSFLNRVFGPRNQADAEGILLGDNEPSLVQRIKDAVPGSMEEVQILQQFEERTLQTATRLADEVINDPNVPMAQRQRMASLRESVNERGTQAEIARVYATLGAARATKTAVNAIKSVPARIRDRVGPRPDPNTITRQSRMPALRQEERNTIIKEIAPLLTPEARADTELMDALPEIVASIRQLSLRPDGMLSREDINDLALLREGLDVFQNPEAGLRKIAQLGEAKPILDALARFTQAERDIKDQNSFIWAMMTPEAQELTTSQMRDMARLIDDFTLRDYDDATSNQILNALAPVFGSRERAAQVLEVYAQERAPSVLDDDAFLDDGTEVHDLGSDALSDLEEARQRGLTRDFSETGPEVSREDVLNLAVEFGVPHARRPELVGSARARKQIEDAMARDPNARMINYGDYVAMQTREEPGGDQAEIQEARLRSEYNRILADIRERMGNNLMRDKGWMQRQVGRLQTYMTENDLADAERAQVLAKIKRLEAKIPNAEDRSTAIERLRREGETLSRTMEREGYQQAINRYEIVLAHNDGIYADDNALKRFQALLDRRVDPNTYRGGKEAADAKNKEIQATRVLIKMRGTSTPIALSAESMWKSAGDQLGSSGTETLRDRAARLFAEALYSVLLRPDVEGIAEGGLTDSTVIDRKGRLTFGDVKMKGKAIGVEGLDPGALAARDREVLSTKALRAELDLESMTKLRSKLNSAWREYQIKAGIDLGKKALKEDQGKRLKLPIGEYNFKLDMMNEFGPKLDSMLEDLQAQLDGPQREDALGKLKVLNSRKRVLEKELNDVMDKLFPVPENQTYADLGGETTDVFPEARYHSGMVKIDQANVYMDRSMAVELKSLSDKYGAKADALMAEAEGLLEDGPRFYEPDTGLYIGRESRRISATRKYGTDGDAVTIEYAEKNQVNSDFNAMLSIMSDSQLRSEISRKQAMLDKKRTQLPEEFVKLLEQEIAAAQAQVEQNKTRAREATYGQGRASERRIAKLEGEIAELTKANKRGKKGATYINELKEELAWEKAVLAGKEKAPKLPGVLAEGADARARYMEAYENYYKMQAPAILGKFDLDTAFFDQLHSEAVAYAKDVMSGKEGLGPTRESMMGAARGRPRSWTDTEKQAVIDQVVRMRGPEVQVLMNRLHSELGGAGTWTMNPETMQRTIQIAVNAADPMGAAYHESMHDFFNMLLTSPEGRALAGNLRSVVNSPMVVNQLREMLKNHPDALAQIEYPDVATARSMPIDQVTEARRIVDEERLAYAFQFWAANQLRVTDHHKGILSKIAQFFRNLFNVMSREQQFEDVMVALQTGNMQDRSVVADVLAERGARTLGDKLQTVSGVAGTAFDKIIRVSTDNLRRTNVPALAQIADMFYQEAGVEQGGKMPFIQRRAQQSGVYMNQLAGVLEGTTRAERKRMVRNLQSMKAPSNEREVALRNLLSEMFDYMKNAGVQRYDALDNTWKDLLPLANYFPRHWDRKAVLNNKKEFINLLMLEGGLDRSQAEASVKAIAHGTGQLELAESRHHMGFTPFNSSVLDRQFTFINENNAEKFARFQVDDVNDIMTSYIYQAVHRAEYARDFGNNGELLMDKLREASEQGATREELAMAAKAVRGLEGTLGHNMNVATKELMSGAMTVANVILLPLAIFSQMVDPLNIAVRTGDIKEAGRAYVRALKGLKNKAVEEFTKQKVADPDRELAVMLGIIDKENMLEAMGMVYGSHHMSRTMRNINRKFFRWNGMEGWNNQMRIAATVAGERYLLANTENGRFMQEIGLEKGDVLTTPDGRLAVTSEQIMDAMKRDGKRYGNVSHLDKATEIEMRVREAMFRFVDSAIIRPHAGQRATWMSDPRFLLVAHLKQFAYSFQSVILRRIGNEMTHGNRMPAGLLMAYLPVMVASDMAKWMTVGGGIPNSIQGFGDLFQHAVARSGILGKFEFGLDVAGDLGRGRLPGVSLIGPTGEHAVLLAQWMAGAPMASTERLLDRSIPFLRYTS